MAPGGFWGASDISGSAPALMPGGFNAAISLGLGMRLHRVHPPQLWAEDRLLQVGRGSQEGSGGAGGTMPDHAPWFCPHQFPSPGAGA